MKKRNLVAKDLLTKKYKQIDAEHDWKVDKEDVLDEGCPPPN